MSKSTRSYSKPIAPSTNLIEDINQINKRLEKKSKLEYLITLAFKKSNLVLGTKLILRFRKFQKWL